MNRKLAVMLVLGLAMAVVAGVVIVRPKTPVAGALTRQVFGAALTILEAKRDPSGKLAIKLELSIPTAARAGNIEILDILVTDARGKTLAGNCCITCSRVSSSPGLEKRIYTCENYTLPSGASHVNVRQVVCLRRPGTQVISSVDINPLSFAPKTVVAGRLKYTVTGLAPNQTRFGEFEAPGSKPICFVNVHMETPYSLPLPRASLWGGRAETGNRLSGYLGFGGSYASVPSAPPPPAPLSAVIAKHLDPEAAEQQRQASEFAWNDSHTVVREGVYVFSPLAKPYPKKLTLTLTGEYDPDPKDRAVVLFRNVPVTR